MQQNVIFKTSDEWITFLYNKHNKFISPVARELGVGFCTNKKIFNKNLEYGKENQEEVIIIGIDHWERKR